MKVGYVRVSDKGQNPDRQTDLMEELGVEKVYIEKISGKNMERPELKQMLSFVREGDSIIVESISRLARNTRDLLEITEKLDSLGVEFISKKENIDTSTPTGKFILTVFGAISELERNYIRERQAEGIASAKKRNKHLGRRKTPLPENWYGVVNELQTGKITAVEAMKVLNLKKTNFYKLLADYKHQTTDEMEGDAHE